MARKPVAKRYRLGAPLSWSDANRLLGRPTKTPLSWREFQEHAKRNNSSKKHES